MNTVIDLLKDRANNYIDLIGSSSIPFPEVCEINSLPSTICRIEGHKDARYFPGTEPIDSAEKLADDKIRELFSLGDNYETNIQLHSATQANHIVWKSILNKGDYVMGLSLEDGGHISHILGLPEHVNFISFPVGKNGIDYEKLKDIAISLKPKIIIGGGTSYTLDINFSKLRSIADLIGALLHADLAHIAPFSASGLHSVAVPFAHTITLDASKNLRGPKGGILIYRTNLRKKIKRLIFPLEQSSPNMTSVVAKACMLSLWEPVNLKLYAKQLQKNSNILGNELVKGGLTLVYEGSKTHLLLINLINIGITGKEGEFRLEKHNILANRNSIPMDKLKPWIGSGLRIGTTSITILSYQESDIILLAKMICNILKMNECAKHELDYLINKYHSQILIPPMDRRNNN